MKTTVTQLVVHPDGEPVWHKAATEINLDEGFVRLVQYPDEGTASERCVEIDFDEWPAVRKAVERLIPKGGATP